MFSSQNTKTDFFLNIYQDKRTVFRLIDIGMMLGETNLQPLSKKLNYYVNKGLLLNPRKGIYAKPEFEPVELACRILSPSYISLEYVLQQTGIIFQFDTQFTLVSYLSRTLEIENLSFRFRKIKNTVLANSLGIIRKDNHVNIASAERAFLDLLYFEPEFYFDNLNPLNPDLVQKILPSYQSQSLNQRVNKLLKYA